MQRTAAQAVRQGGRRVQGKRFLPQRQPRLREVQQRRGLVQEQRQLDLDSRRLVGLIEFVEFVEHTVFFFVDEFAQFDAGRRLQLTSYPQAYRLKLPSSPRGA